MKMVDQLKFGNSYLIYSSEKGSYRACQILLYDGVFSKTYKKYRINHGAKNVRMTEDILVNDFIDGYMMFELTANEVFRHIEMDMIISNL